MPALACANVAFCQALFGSDCSHQRPWPVNPCLQLVFVHQDPLHFGFFNPPTSMEVDNRLVFGLHGLATGHAIHFHSSLDRPAAFSSHWTGTRGHLASSLSVLSQVGR